MSNRTPGPRPAEGPHRQVLPTRIDIKTMVVPAIENQEDLESLIAAHDERFQPTDVTERCLVDFLIMAKWSLQRYLRMDEAARRLKAAGQPHTNLKSLRCWIDACHRNYQSSLKALNKLRASSPKPKLQPAVAALTLKTMPCSSRIQ